MFKLLKKYNEHYNNLEDTWKLLTAIIMLGLATLHPVGLLITAAVIVIRGCFVLK